MLLQALFVLRIEILVINGSELTLADTAEAVDKVAGGGGLTSIDVTDNDKIDMILLFTHEKM